MSATTEPTVDYDIHIKNGTIVDGTRVRFEERDHRVAPVPRYLPWHRQTRCL